MLANGTVTAEDQGVRAVKTPKRDFSSNSVSLNAADTEFPRSAAA
jgi:hypothetical protein